MSGYPDRLEGMDMELINLDVSEYGISLTTYFGDVYVYWRALVLVAAVVVLLRIAKAIRRAWL